jgi:hypothetical protein
VVKLAAHPAPRKPPTLPKGYPATSRKWWGTVWRSPMAAVWLEAEQRLLDAGEIST